MNFRKKVYQVVAKIKKGEVLSYQEVAKRAGSPFAFRAVGNILKTHQIENLPCHRVIKSNGEIGGYRWGKEKKLLLLRKEGWLIDKKGRLIKRGKK